MFQRRPQPPVNPALRALERHSFWPGLIGAVVAVVLLFLGARHLTGIETTDGGTAWETQLVKAYSSSGLKFPEAAPPPPPVRTGDPFADATALERWQRTAHAAPPDWKVRIDLSAAAPCPT